MGSWRGFPVLVIAGVLGCAATLHAQDAPPTTQVDSPTGQWSVTIPSSWTAEVAEAGGRFSEWVALSGPPEHLAIVSVQVFAGNPPLDALITQLQAEHKRMGVSAQETRSAISGRDAVRFQWVVTQGDQKLQANQIVVDGVQRKVMVTTLFPEPASPENAQAFEQILATLVVSDRPATQAPSAVELRKLPEEGIEIELPRGGVMLRRAGGFQIGWKEEGLLFLFERRRSTLSAAERASERFQPAASGAGGEVTHEVVDRKDVQIAGRPGCRVRAYTVVGGRRVMSVTFIALAVSAEEGVMFGFAKAGEVPLEGFAPAESACERAKISPMLAAPLAAIPALSADGEIWQGRAVVKLPQGWAAAPLPAAESPRKGAPVPAEERLWCAAGAPDLGITCATGTIAGGRDAFEEWLKLKKLGRATISPLRPLQVGGRPACAWDLESGPARDRWITTVVVAFDGTRYDLIESAYPVRAKAAYGGLAEKVAATVHAKE